MRFIHLADVHLGADPEREYLWSAKRGQEIWDTFRQVVTEAGRQKIDLLLIAGDLFHGQPLLRELKEVNYLFSAIPDTQVVMIAGNHDYLRENSPYQNFSWNANVHFLKGETVQRLSFPKLHTYVYGFSYHQRQISEERYESLRPGGEEGCHILLAHGGDGQHIPIRYEKLAQAGFSYVALGHIHQPQILYRISGRAMAYCGSLEPIERHEEGVHGYIAGTWTRDRLDIRMVPAACRRYVTLECGVDEEMTQFELEEAVKRLISEKGRENMYRLRLTGTRDREQKWNLERLSSLGQIVDVLDQTRPAFDLEKLRRRFAGSLIGEYIESFQGKDLSETEEKALDYGLSALLETRE